MEMAVAAIMLVTLLVGMIGTAQYVMIHQIISNASRTAARHAIRASTMSDTQVRNTVQDYMERCLPSIPVAVISDALTVTVLGDGSGSGDDDDDEGEGGADNVTSLDEFTSGDKVVVQVQFDFDAVRWLPAVLSGQTIAATTTMRRN